MKRLYLIISLRTTIISLQYCMISGGSNKPIYSKTLHIFSTDAGTLFGVTVPCNICNSLTGFIKAAWKIADRNSLINLFFTI